MTKQSRFIFLLFTALFILTTLMCRADEPSTYLSSQVKVHESENAYGAHMKTFTVYGVTFNMIQVKGGEFIMGGTEEQGDDVDVDETPAHPVTVDDFYIGETEVTQELWEAIMGRNPSLCVGAQKPVERIRLVECEVFLMKLNALTHCNFRLPKEKEWEYAARGGHQSVHTKYAGSDDYDTVAWYCNNSENTTHDVKGKEPNELGIYDMSGNVDEWCEDDWQPYDPAKSIDMERAVGVRRGGGCLDFAKHLRVSDRRASSREIWNFDIGIRLVESSGR